jgi:hypothetical protein
VLSSSCLAFDVATSTVVAKDLLQFLVAAWVVHPNFIPNKVECIIPEPEEPLLERAPLLFLRADEVIHSKCNTLQLLCPASTCHCNHGPGSTGLQEVMHRGVGPGDPFLVMVVVSTRACPLQGRHATPGSSIPTQLQ